MNNGLDRLQIFFKKKGLGKTMEVVAGEPLCLLARHVDNDVDDGQTGNQTG